MGKILLFASFVVTLAAAALGFINKGKYADAVAQSERTSADLRSKTAELKTKETALKETNDKLTAAKAENDQISAQAAAAKSDADKATAQLADLTARATSAEDKAKTADANAQSLQKAFDDYKTANVAPAQSGPSPEDKAQLEEMKTVTAQLQSQLESTKTQLELANKAEADRRALKMRDGVEGRVLAVNPAWNFVVLNLGDKQGVVNNAELLVKRGRQLVGKIRITSVEPSTSIADIVANSVPSGTVISPGDNVIFQAVEE
jgi:cell shape-determining protein MreC